MQLKERVMELLRSADRQGLERLVARDRRAVRHLQGRLWDPDEGVRRGAACALAAAAAAHPELGRDLIRRLLWALNDESATNGAFALPALGEIGFRCPHLIAPFLGCMTQLSADETLRPALLAALSRIAAAEAPVEPRRERIDLDRWEDDGEA
jgi:hypothetical protein